MKAAYTASILIAALCLLQFMYLRLIDSEALQDFRDIDKDGPKDTLGKTWHRQSFLRIFATAVAMSLPFLYISTLLALSLLLLQAAEFWFLFDKQLNRLRGKHPLYVGERAAIDKAFRRHFPRFPEKAMSIAKVCLLVSSIFLVIYFLIKTFSEHG